MKKVKLLCVLFYACGCSYAEVKDEKPTSEVADDSASSVPSMVESREFSLKCNPIFSVFHCYNENIEIAPRNDCDIDISYVLSKNDSPSEIEVTSSIEGNQAIVSCVRKFVARLDCPPMPDATHVALATKVSVRYSEEGRMFYLRNTGGNRSVGTDIDVDVGRRESIKQEFVEARNAPEALRSEWIEKFKKEGVGPIRSVLNDVTSDDNWLKPTIVEILRKKYVVEDDNNIRFKALEVLFRSFPDTGVAECKSIRQTKDFLGVLCTEQLLLLKSLPPSEVESIYEKGCPEPGSKLWGIRTGHFMRESHDEWRFSAAIVYLCKGGAAEKVGLRVGDNIVEVDGQQMDSEDIIGYIRDPTKKDIQLTIIRDGARQVFPISHPNR